MPPPVHFNPVNADRLATAPYNFIPQPERVIADVPSADALPRHNSYGDANYPYTGYFSVTLTTKSPLYIRGLMTMADFEQEGRQDAKTGYREMVKNRPAFFHTSDKEQPVIPGSSLRGMLRGLLEVVSYGKLEKVTNKKLIYRAVGDTTSLGAWYREQTLGPNLATGRNMRFAYPLSRLRGGYLKREGNKWCIAPAMSDPVKHYGESFVHVEYRAANPLVGGYREHTTHKVLVTPAPRTTPPRTRPNLRLELAVTSSVSAVVDPIPPGMVDAVLVKSGQMGRIGVPGSKHMHCAIYEEDSVAARIPIDDAMWRAYEEDRDMQRGIPARKLEHDGDPLFYLLDASGKLVFFGPTMMFRLPYKRSLHHLIPDYTRNLLQIDYADALFGYIRDTESFKQNRIKPLPPQGDRARAYAGRISVTDAMLEKDVPPQDLWLKGSATESLPLSILSTPKPTSFQLYLVQHREEKDDLSHYDSPQRDASRIWRGHKSVLRGMKRYWLQGDRTIPNLRPLLKSPSMDQHGEPEQDSKLHTLCNPIRSGISFTFRVYFENLSERELGTLCWTLHPVGDVTKTYCHSLGMGKSLGMGAVCLDATLHLTNRQTRYTRLFALEPNERNQWETGEQQADGEAMRDRIRLEKRVKSFEAHLLDELKPVFPEDPARPCIRLAEVKRIGMLLAMMEWQDQPKPERAESMGFRDRTRRVLPDPGYYAPHVLSLAVPTVTDTPGGDPAPKQETHGSGEPPAKAQALPQKQETPQGNTQSVLSVADVGRLKEIRDNIAAIRARGDVDRAVRVVRLIGALQAEQMKQQCAVELRQRLQQHNVWNRPPHNSLPWHKQLEAWLAQPEQE